MQCYVLAALTGGGGVSVEYWRKGWGEGKVWVLWLEWGVTAVRTAEGNPESTLGLSRGWEGSGGRRSRNSTCETTWHKKIPM